MIRTTPWEANILRAATATWGKEAQLQVAYGECGEFVTLAGRAKQGRATDEDFIDEIADNILMMAQMRHIFGEEKVDARLEYKMSRLLQRINKEKKA